MTTFVEGTGAKLGTGITTGATHRLSWDAATDWSVLFGETKIEILANDGRGLLGANLITIPAAGPLPALRISRSPLGNGDFMNAWFWLIAKKDSAIVLTSGKVYGTASSGAYNGKLLADDTTTTADGRAFLFARMNVRLATTDEITRAKNGATGTVNQWEPRNTTVSTDRPRKINEYGFDTYDYIQGTYTDYSTYPYKVITEYNYWIVPL